MLLGKRLIGGSKKKYAVWTDYLFDNVNTNTRSFTGVNIGDPSSDRILVLTTFGSSSGATYTSSLTINGSISATKQFEVTTSVSNARLSVWTAAVPDGATCNIDTVQISPAAGYESIQVFAMYGVSSEAPVSNASDTASPGTVSSTVQAGDLAIAVAEGKGTTSGASISWTGLTEQSDFATLDYSIYYKYSSSAYDKVSVDGTVSATATASAGAIKGTVLGIWR